MLEARHQETHGKRYVLMAPRDAARPIEVTQSLGPRGGADKPELFDEGCTYVAIAPGKGAGLFSAYGFEEKSAVAAMIDPRRMDESHWLKHCASLRLPSDAFICLEHSHRGFYDAAFPAGPIRPDHRLDCCLMSAYLAPKWYNINYSAHPNVRIRLAGQGRPPSEQSLFWEATRRIEPHEELTCEMYLHVPTDWHPLPARLEPTISHLGVARPSPYLYPKFKYVRSYRRRELVGWGHGRRSDYESHSSRASSDDENLDESSSATHLPFWLCDESELGASDSRAGAPPAQSAIK